jgi:hypothetical protein
MTTEQLARNLLAIIDSEMYVNDFGGLQAGRDATTDIHAAMGKLEEALAQPEQKPTYTSTQSTNCAICGEHKHTPPRIDAMGGYVCLTCIDKKLGALLGEFGYAQQPEQREWVKLTDEEVRECYAHVKGVTVSEAVTLTSVVRITQAKLKGKNT